MTCFLRPCLLPKHPSRDVSCLLALRSLTRIKAEHPSLCVLSAPPCPVSCCSCTCEYEYDDDFACSADGSGFDCKDPAAPCIGEERTKDDDFSFSGADDFVMSYEFIPWEQEGPLPSVDGAVEVGTKTDVGVSATAYDVRPGASSGMAGCGEAGCAPDNTRDGIASEIESRWSCATTLVIGEGPCQIAYIFAEPQDIVDIQVAFWKGNERVRTLEVGGSEGERS